MKNIDDALKALDEIQLNHAEFFLSAKRSLRNCFDINLNLPLTPKDDCSLSRDIINDIKVTIYLDVPNLLLIFDVQ